MAELRLVPHAAPPGTIDLWVAAGGLAEPPEVTFRLDGHEVVPAVLRPLEAVRIGEAAPAPGRPRLFTGGYRFEGVGGEVVIDAAIPGASARLATRPIPARLPEDRWFNVWLGSCYDRNTEASPNLVNRVAAHLAAGPDTRPDLTLLVGDQVYLDVPLTEVIGRFGEPGLGGITAQFEEDYRLNWMAHLSELLAAAPVLCTPDDHEFWNNFPARVPWLPRTLRARGRLEWEHAARRCYDAFQRSVGLPDPAVIDLGAASIFVLDTRTWRRVDRAAAARADHLDALDRWADRVASRGQTGIFVTGQSMLKPRVWALVGQLTDFELANYGDYHRILAALRRAGTPANPVICLTGDVHFGRVVQASDPAGRPRLYEIISSPLSLCSDPRSAHQPLLSSLFHRWFGEPWLHLNRPWPRHPSPAVPPLTWPAPLPHEPLQCVQRYGHRGDQLAIVGFRPSERGGGLRVRVGFVTIGPREEQWEPVWIGPFETRNGIDVLGAFGEVGAMRPVG